MIARLRRAYPLKLELLPLLLVAWGVYLVVASYPDLPARIPTHFDAAGNPDRWGSRGMLFLVLAAEVALVYLNTTLLSLVLAAIGDFRGHINLPFKRKDLTLEQGEAMRTLVLRLLFWLKTLACGLLSYLLYQMVQVAQGRQPGIGNAWWLFVIALVLLPGLFFVQLWRIARQEA